MTELERALAATLSASTGCPCPDTCSCDAAAEERSRAASIRDWRHLDDARRIARQIRTEQR